MVCTRSGSIGNYYLVYLGHGYGDLAANVVRYLDRLCAGCRSFATDISSICVLDENDDGEIIFDL